LDQAHFNNWIVILGGVILPIALLGVLLVLTL
jgi:hypothetical protein